MAELFVKSIGRRHAAKFFPNYIGVSSCSSYLVLAILGRLRAVVRVSVRQWKAKKGRPMRLSFYVNRRFGADLPDPQLVLGYKGKLSIMFHDSADFQAVANALLVALDSQCVFPAFVGVRTTYGHIHMDKPLYRQWGEQFHQQDLRYSLTKDGNLVRIPSPLVPPQEHEFAWRYLGACVERDSVIMDIPEPSFW